jgi:hypothetical protein
MMKNIIIMLTFSVTCLFSRCTCSSSGTEGNIIKNDDVLTLKFDFHEKSVNIFDIGLIYDVEILNLDCKEAIFGDVDKIKNVIFSESPIKNEQTWGMFLKKIKKKNKI